jgi:hypothetical protein
MDFKAASCQIVGDQECRAMLIALQKRAFPSLKALICRMAASDTGECEFAQCPPGPGGWDYLGVDEKEKHDGQLRWIADNKLATRDDLAALACNRSRDIRDAAIDILRRRFDKDFHAACIPCN